ncbi:CIA30 family protein [candidate division KSB1 bacterium]|nr:CIA30 family protein [candidate division KSB1 bacterium]
MRALLFILVLVVECFSQDLLLQNAQIVDPVAQKISRGSILIRNGKIEQILNAAPKNFAGEKVDLTGKWIIPGLNDMHVHSYGNMAPGNNMQLFMTPGAAKTMLYCGVTGFLDLFSAESEILRLRDQQRRDGMSGADIYCAGPILTCTGGHGTEYGIPTRVINSPAEAEKEIADLAPKKPDVIKIVYDHAFGRMPTIDHATMEAAVKAAAKHGIKTVVHIGTWQDAKEAILAGANAITHLHGEEIPDEVVALMKQKNVYSIPTMTVETELVYLAQNPALLDNSLLAAVATPAVVDAYRDTSKFDNRTKAWLRWQKSGQANYRRSIKKLDDGGVKIMAGTDAGNFGTFQGFSVHREMQIMAEAGVSIWQALAAATTIPGEFLEQPFGVRAGSVANLVVLNASPVENISNTQNIAMVIHHGKVVNRDDLIKSEAPPSTSQSAQPWTQALLDDFSKTDLTSALGNAWDRNVDTDWGGKSTLQHEYRDGALRVWGRLQPSPGAPGLAGFSLDLEEQGTLFDVTGFAGMRLRIKNVAGPLFLKIVTSGVANFDYHQVMIQSSPEFQELKLPFSQFRQFWSAPVAWTGKDVRGVALWVSGFQPADFEFVIDRIEFYTGK